MKLKTVILTCVCLISTFSAMAANFAGRQILGNISTAQTGASEISGVVESRKNPHVLWLINDNGNPLIAVSTNGTYLGSYYIAEFDQDVKDWEDIAIGPGPIAGVDYLFAGNIGDNQVNKPFRLVARVVEPDVNIDQSPVTNTLYGADILTIVYGSVGNTESFDVESLMVDINKDIYIIGKRKNSSNWNPGAYPRLYKASYPRVIGLSVTNNMSYEGTIDIFSGAMPTGADIAPSGEQILIKTGGDGLFGSERVYHWERDLGDTIWEAFSSSPVKTQVPYTDAGQDESVGWQANDAGYYTVSEGADETINYYKNTLSIF